MQLNRRVRTFASIQRCKSTENKVTLVCRLCTCRTLLLRHHRLMGQVMESLQALIFCDEVSSDAFLMQNDLVRQRSGGHWHASCMWLKTQEVTVFGTHNVINVSLHHKMSCNNYNNRDSRKSKHVHN